MVLAPHELETNRQVSLFAVHSRGVVLLNTGKWAVFSLVGNSLKLLIRLVIAL